MAQYIIELRGHGDVGEWPVETEPRAQRTFEVFKRRATLATARDGMPRRVRLLLELDRMTAEPVEPRQPTESEAAAWDEANEGDRFE